MKVKDVADVLVDDEAKMRFGIVCADLQMDILSGARVYLVKMLASPCAQAKKIGLKKEARLQETKH